MISILLSAGTVLIENEYGRKLRGKIYRQLQGSLDHLNQNYQEVVKVRFKNIKVFSDKNWLIFLYNTNQRQASLTANYHQIPALMHPVIFDW
jgi:hypothetical protein